MLHLLNTYLSSLNLRTLSPMIWISLKDQLSYPEMELEIPIYLWLIEQTTITKKQRFLPCADNTFEHWIRTNLHSVPITTYSLSEQQAKDIITFLRINLEYL